jgi:CDGSH-type Zn-finger protein
MVVKEYGVVGRGGEEGDIMRYPKKEVAEVVSAQSKESRLCRCGER